MLRVTSVTRRFGNLTALDDVSFELHRGQVLAVIGANGAGKSTLIKCIVGLLKFEGSAEVDGIDIGKKPKAARARIGYLPQQPAFHGDMTVLETMTFYAELRRAPLQQARTNLEVVGLDARSDARVSELSGGMRQRLALAVALLGDPALLVLDEPATGLDISARLDLRRLVNEQRQAGKSILLSTHWLEDVPHIADDALLLDHGKVAYYGAAATLAAGDAAASRVYLRLNGHSRDAIPLIAEFSGEHPDRSGDWLIARCPASQKARLVEALLAAGIHILDFRIEEAPVDEAVMRLQNGGLN